MNDLEIGQFRAFGYVVLKDCLDADELQEVQDAFDRVTERAPEFDDFGPSGTRRSISFTEEEEVLGALIEHPKIMEAMRDIDGTEFLFIGNGDLTANKDDVYWHTDGNPSMQPMTVKTVFYLSEASDGDGALNIIPGSFHPDFSAALYLEYAPLGEEYRRRSHNPGPSTRENVPGMVQVLVNPCDAVIWDNRMWHSAWKRRDGKPRRNIFYNYVRDPGDDPIRGRVVREHVAYHRSAPSRRFVYSKKMMEAGGPARGKMAARLEALGVENVREG